MATKQQVLDLLKIGKTIKEIAAELNTTENNIRTHRARIIKQNLWKPKDSGLQWSFDDIESAADFWIDVLNKAKTTAEIQRELEAVRGELTQTQQDLILCRKKLQGMTEKELKYKQAIQSGDVREPVSNGSSK